MIEASNKPNKPGLFYCRACDDHISLGKTGETAITRHLNNQKHKKNLDAVRLSAGIQCYQIDIVCRKEHRGKMGSIAEEQKSRNDSKIGIGAAQHVPIECVL